MVDTNFVNPRIGMALISAKRLEFITKQLVECLKEFHADVYGITGDEFLTLRKKQIWREALLTMFSNVSNLIQNW